MIAFLVVLLAFCCFGTSVSANSVFVPNVKPVLWISPLEGKIQVDGLLDDPGWQRAVRADNFTETNPGDQVQPPVDTEVFITYDETRLYIAFIAHDSPDFIRSSLRDRDEIFDDDHVGVLIDTYDNAAWAYQLYVNPLGVQGDMRWTPSGEDIGFDVVFESRGRITEDGYQVEMAVPFKSLRFPNRDEQRWRATFVRVHPRDSRRYYSWAATSRDEPCYPCQFGTIVGLRNVKPGTQLELLPSVFGAQSAELDDFDKPKNGFTDTDNNLDAGLSLRYGVTTSMSAELALNPDFSQVESDAAQIDVNTTFALFFPERRPFFQEGSDLYRSFYNVIYTRMINDPSVAGKLTQRSDRSAFIYLAGYDEETPLIIPLEQRSELAAPGKSLSNILRARRTIGRASHVAAVVTDRRYDIGGSGTAGGVDALFRFAQNYRIQMQFLGSFNREPDDTTLTPRLDGETFADGKHTVTLDGESFSGYAAHTALARDARHWNSEATYWGSSPTFRADNGFVTRNDENRIVWYNNYIFYPTNRFLDRLWPNVNITRRWNANGDDRALSIESWVDFQFKKQTRVVLGYDVYNENFRGVDFEDMPLYYGEVNTAFSNPLQLGVWVGVGDRIARNVQPAPTIGDGIHIDLFGTIKLWERLIIEPTGAFSNLFRKDDGSEIFEGWILRTRFSYQFTRELFLRLVLQHDDFGGSFNVEPLLTYKVNPFTIFYVGANSNLQDYNHRSIDPALRTSGFEPTSWQWYFKLQYFYRV